MSFRWVSLRAVLAIHAEQLAQHGGPEGLRDEGLLESALARLQNLAAYEDTSIAKCAAAYAFGIVRKHPFNDGNKRTGFVVAAAFLLLNGYYLTASEIDVFKTITKLAAGELSEPDLGDWVEKFTIKT